MLKPESLSAKAREFPGLNLESIEGSVLATIINPKVEDVAKLPAPDELPARRTPFRSLYRALKQPEGRSFILECKKSSPTLGDFCKDFSLDRLLSCYESRAAAISVLCEEHFFKGSLEYLSYVRERTALPVLCKDFIIDERQLHAAVAAGADAVLLMLSLLTRERYLELYAKARELGLEVLTEVDTREDAEFAVAHRIPVVGINNRDLRVLKIDLRNARDLAPLFPEDVAVVSESGINTYSDIFSLRPIKSFLIGSSLSGSDDIIFKGNSMLYGLNKVCGIRSAEALEAAIAGHAAIAGLIFAKKSPRCIDPEAAAKLTSSYKGQIRFAAVFVDSPLEEIRRIVALIHADYVQLHGHESVEFIAQLRVALPGIKIIKALNVADESAFAHYGEYLDCADLMLLDSSAPGSGKSFAWDTIPAKVDRSRTLLSGGIGIDNLREALTLGFAGVDINSRLESSKGVKDPALISQALRIIKEFI